MNTWSGVLYVSMSGAALLLMGLGFGLAALMPSIDRWSKRFFITFFGVLFLKCCASLAEIFFYEVMHLAGAMRVTEFLLFLFGAVPLFLLTVFWLHCCGEDWRKSRFFRAVTALWGFFFLLVVIAQFSPFFYRVMPDGRFAPGPGYTLIVAPAVVNGLISLAGLVSRREQLTKRYYLALLIAQLPLIVVLTVHLFVPVFTLIDIGLAVSALAMYGMILSDQIEQYLRQQREIAQQHADILVLQMRPHFIHNTLVSIYYLCEQDPKEAQRVTLDFNTYLEKNLTALASDGTIPFSEELEHTRAYLNVEQALYDENLFVGYDTPHTRFRLPPLTVQPIVENAIRHALDPDSEPVRILIQTRKTDRGSQVIVSDNGPGFAPADDDKPHIALANIRQRLELMCGGEMEISPREGGGTVVRLTIP